MKQTPSQTAGPFLHIGMMPEGRAPRPVADVAERPIALHGRLFDSTGAPVVDGLVEMWQENAVWDRSAMDDEGRWHLRAARPDAYSFVSLWIIARGINTGLHTRLYFPDCAWRDDAAMTTIPAPRRSTLVASQGEDGAYHLDIRLGGEGETVFFDV